MGWYVLYSKPGREEEIVRSLNQRLSGEALEEAFVLRSERLWRAGGGSWKRIVKDMFPGYVFLRSSHPKRLSEELKEYRRIVRVMEEPGYLISVYEEEEQRLRRLCGERHMMELSYGYREDGVDHIFSGPLKGLEGQILKADWHRRFAKLECSVAGKPAAVWAGLGLLKEMETWKAG